MPPGSWSILIQNFVTIDRQTSYYPFLVLLKMGYMNEGCSHIRPTWRRIYKGPLCASYILQHILILINVSQRNVYVCWLFSSTCSARSIYCICICMRKYSCTEVLHSVSCLAHLCCYDLIWSLGDSRLEILVRHLVFTERKISAFTKELA